MAEVPRPFTPVDFGWVLTCFLSGTSESEFESSTISADLTLGSAFAFFGGGNFGVEGAFPFLEGFGVDSLGVAFVNFFLALMIPPPTLRIGFSASSSADRFLGRVGVTE